MKLTVDMVSDVFQQMLDGRMSREQARDWAYVVMLNDDSRIIEFSSRAEHDRIWPAVMWLLAADLEIEPGEYFHSDDQFREAWDKMLNLR